MGIFFTCTLHENCFAKNVPSTSVQQQYVSYHHLILYNIILIIYTVIVIIVVIILIYLYIISFIVMV